MKMICDVPDEVIKSVRMGTWCGSSIAEKMIANGIPLPKGHRFIDADEILNHAHVEEDEEGNIFVQKYYCIKKEIMDNALVLFDTLEADKEQNEAIS